MKTDIEIAQSCRMKKITQVAQAAGIPEEYLEQYGNYKAKVDYRSYTTDGSGADHMEYSGRPNRLNADRLGAPEWVRPFFCAPG